MSTTPEPITCAACNKKVEFVDAYFCERCLEVGTCGPECWAKVSAAHGDVCSCEVGAELGICPDCDCDGKPVEQQVGAARTTPHAPYMGPHPHISAHKLHTMLEHGRVRGHPLTTLQRHYFYHLLGPRAKRM